MTSKIFLSENHISTKRSQCRALFAVCALMWLIARPASAQLIGSATDLSSSANPSCLGQSVTFTATVTGIPIDAGTPAGTVDFKDGGVVLSTQPLDGGGQASFSTAALAAGSHSMTAEYSGDSVFNGSSSLVITQVMNTAPSVNSNPANQTICIGSGASFNASATGSPTPALQWQVSTDGGANFSDIVGATAPTYSFTPILSDSGKQYRAQFTNTCGTMSSTAALLTVNPKPTATVSGTATICAGSSTAIQAALTGTGPWTVVWSDGATNNNVLSSPLTRLVNPITNKTYTVTAVSDANCTGTASGSAAITVNTAPSVTANPINKAVCAGGTVSFTASASGSPTPSIQWQVSSDGGASFNNIAGATNGTYTLTTSAADNGKQYRAQFSNSCGSPTSSAAQLTVNALPICSIAGADAVCSSSLNNVYSGPVGMSVYRWAISGSGAISGATNAQSISVNAGASGSFTVTLTLTNASGCTSTCSKTVTNLALPTAAVSGGGTICPGNSASIQAALMGVGPWTVVWSDGVTQNNVAASPASRSVSPSSTTIYTVTSVSDANCSNGGSGNATVTVNAAPVVSLNPTNRAVCAGGSVSFTASASGTPTPTIQWQVSTDGGASFNNIAGATNNTHTFSTSGADNNKQFRAQFSNICAGAISSAALLTVNALPICSVTGADSVCSSSLNNVYSGPGGMTVYRWAISGSGTISGTTNAQTVAINAGAPGTFTVTLTLTNASGCTSTCSKTVTNLALPTATVSGGGAICPGGSASIQAALTGTGPWTVMWSDGVTQNNVIASPATRTVSPSSTTIYSVTTVSDANCANSGTGNATVTLNAAPVVTSNPANKAVCAGSSVSFAASASGAPSPTVQWQVSTNGGGAFVNIAGATNSTYSFATSLNDSGKQFRALFTNTCGSAISSAAALTVNPIPVATITTPSVICPNSSGNLASVPSAGAGAGYVWTVSGGTITSGQGTPNITYTAGGGNISISVTISNAFGCTASGSQNVSLASQGLDLEGWKNKAPLQWQGSTFNNGDHQYSEGNSIPQRLELKQMCPGSSWCVVLRYDFKDANTGRHFYDFLATYNASEPTVNGQECANFNCGGAPTTYPIPLDPSLTYQLPGNFTVYNGTITNVSSYTVVSGSTTEKQITITGVTATGAGARDVLIFFGGHLARENEWGTGNGASSFPGASAKVLYQFCGDASFGNLGVNPGGIIKQADLSITKSATPNPLCAGNVLSYSLVVSNAGPNQASPVTVLDPLPAGTTLSSVTMSQGSYTGTSSLNFALGALNAGSNATITIFVNVNTNAATSLTNTATVSATAPADPFTANNSATAIVAVFPQTSASPLSDQVVCLGSPATFSTVPYGAAPFTFRWTKNGATIAGATNSSFPIPSVSASDVATYCVVVSGTCGGATNSVTNCAALILSTNASTTALVGMAKCPGESATFSTTPGGTGPFSFVWRKDGSIISDATANSLTINNVSATDAGNYCVQVSGVCGSANSCAALTVRTNMTATPLSDQTKCPGETASFSTTALGTGPFSYIWRKDGVMLAGQTTSSLTIPSVSGTNAGTYCVEVTGNCNSATNCATLTVNTVTSADPLISQTNCPGSTVTFSTVPHGTGPFSYQWMKNGAILNGQSDSILTLTNLSAGDAGSYSLIVSGLCTATTNSATLTMNQNAVIATAPLSMTNCPGTTASFSVTAGGTGPFTYQWFKAGNLLAGQTNGSLVLGNVNAEDAGTYSIVVNGVCGNAVTNSANLTVNVPATADALVMQALCPGSTANFGTVAHGTGPFTYQWFKDGTPITAQTNSSLSLPNISSSSSGGYSVVIDGACGIVTNSAALKVNAPTTVDPVGAQAVCPGGTATLTAIAQGAGPFTYLWRKDGKLVPGGTQMSLVISNVSVLDVGTYSVVVSGLCNSATNSGTLIINAPTTASPLANQTVCFGGTATFTTTPAGVGPFSFVWRKNGSLIAGKTGSSLTLNHLAASDAAIYTVEITGQCNSVTNVATLAVESIGLTSPAGFANSSAIAINDFSPAMPYPSSIEVSCVPSPLTGVTVTITNLSHTYASDINMLLVGPSGQAVMLMADAGDGNAINGATLRFSDAALAFLSQSGTIVTGVYKPTDYGLIDDLPAPAPPRPYASALSSFIGTDANGTWSLYVADDNYADTGIIAGGWSLTLTWGTNPPAVLGSSTLQSNGSYASTLQGQAGTVYVIEASTDLVTWTPILTNVLSSNLWNFVDVNSTNFSRRFYRAASGPAVK